MKHKAKKCAKILIVSGVFGLYLFNCHKKAISKQPEISVLLKHEIESNDIKFIVNVKPQNLALSIDPELIQQVLINLIKNAVQALEERENKIIELLAYQDEKNNTLFILKDNGPGIDEEAQTKIFIPFFTAKKSGSGIGLSLSRQIMRQHSASISVNSKVDEGTEFILRF